VVAAWLAVIAAVLATGVPARAATNVEGTIAVAGTATGKLYGCGPCSTVVSVTTSGTVTGVDGTTPFAVEWDTNNATITMSIVSDCVTILNNMPPNIDDLTGNVSIGSATLVYNGVSMNATVTGSFSTSPLPSPVADPVPVAGLTLTATAGSISVPINVLSANGLLALVPASDFLCPNPTEPTQFALSGTLLAVA